MISTQVQKAIYDALKQAPALVDGRIFDGTPDGAQFPRISLGEEQIVDDGNTCDDGWIVFSDVHVWSRRPGKVEAKVIMADVVTRLTAISAIDGHTLIAVELDAHHVFTEPDGLTSHGIITMRFVINPA